MGWAFWRGWGRRRSEDACRYVSTAAADREPVRAESHDRDITDARERLQRLSDELAVMTRRQD